MKVFIGACTALVLIISLVGFSAFYVAKTMDTLDKKAGNMPLTITSETDTEAARKLAEGLSEYWSEHSFAVSLCISQRETEYIDLAVKKLFGALDAEDSSAYAEALATFRHYVGHLRDEEYFSADNIL